MNARPKPFFYSVRVLVLVLLACDLSSLFGNAATKPSVIITAPASGRASTRNQIAVQSTATDARGLAWLELWVDGVVVGNEILPVPQTNYIAILFWGATTRAAHSSA